jgi:hypothetical protein
MGIEGSEQAPILIQDADARKQTKRGMIKVGFGHRLNWE